MKIIQLALFSSVPLLALVQPLQAQFGYMTNAGGANVTITNYTGPGGAVTVPVYINSLPVLTIGDNAFHDCTNLTNLTISSTTFSLVDNGNVFTYYFAPSVGNY